MNAEDKSKVLTIDDEGINAHVASFVLRTLMEHKRNPLSAGTIQKRMDEKFSPKYGTLHKAIWRKLILKG